MRSVIEHSGYMLAVSRVSVVVALAAVLAVGNVAVCAGWATTPEARMDCCREGQSCPMQHQGESGSNAQLTQADADRCCASSEREGSNQQMASSLIALSPCSAFVTLQSPSVLESLRRAGWRMNAPHPPPHVPTHVLLSVFVV